MPAEGASKTDRTVLFVCEYNSCRSQLAEALARRLAPPGWRILSAGLTRTVVNDEARRALAEIGIDARELRSKSLDDLDAHEVNVVVVLAPQALDHVRDRYPRARLLERPMDDPVRAPGGPHGVRMAIRSARDGLQRRLVLWLNESRVT